MNDHLQLVQPTGSDLEYMYYDIKLSMLFVTRQDQREVSPIQ